MVIGDAAHPMRPHMGQGGCQAIEDGALLAMSLGRNPSVASHFASFATQRARRVKPIVRQSALMGRVIQGEGLTAGVARRLGVRMPTNVMIRNLSRVGGRAAFDAAAVIAASDR